MGPEQTPHQQWLRKVIAIIVLGLYITILGLAYHWHIYGDSKEPLITVLAAVVAIITFLTQIAHHKG